MVWSSYVAALAVPRSRRFRLPLSLGRVRCGFWSFRVAVVSLVLNVSARLGLVVAVVSLVLIAGLFWVLRGVCGGFVFPRSWCLFGVGCVPSPWSWSFFRARGGFVSFFLRGASCWSTLAGNWELCVVI